MGEFGAHQGDHRILKQSRISILSAGPGNVCSPQNTSVLKGIPNAELPIYIVHPRACHLNQLQVRRVQLAVPRAAAASLGTTKGPVPDEAFIIERPEALKRQIC